MLFSCLFFRMHPLSSMMAKNIFWTLICISSDKAEFYFAKSVSIFLCAKNPMINPIWGASSCKLSLKFDENGALLVDIYCTALR
ncbi:hypothetical protein LDG_6088 [Legionella drancourtii LLAP12]|uniref:Uncharacterized protein n=1 Tax=Legionella drancourtii LLAP12 TaxID=658187 RepID=G9EL33_9GAMM|nr:hypothetical protein LDG_6088 [Legionella drancourtii LLAP12]